MKNKRISIKKIKTNLSLNEIVNPKNTKSKIIKRISGKSINGRQSDGKDKINQDSFLIKNELLGNDDFSLIGVFDGHGAQGHFVSSLLKVFFSEYFTKMDLFKQSINTINTSIKNGFSDPNNIKNYRNNYDTGNSYSNNSANIKNSINSRQINNTTNKNNSNFILSRKNSNFINKEDIAVNNIYYDKLSEFDYSMIRNSFTLAENSFIEEKYDMNFSGSTCVCIYIIENKVICANCGDSRVILVADDKFNVNKNLILNLSIDHKPELKEEASRIIKNNGRIDKVSENGIRLGPMRVWLKHENYPGLAMTRSIGDMVASKIGVTSEPEIIECNINDDSKFIVAASDGIWEILTNEEVADIVNPFHATLDSESAVSLLVEEASKRWTMVNQNFIYFSLSKFFIYLY